MQEQIDQLQAQVDDLSAKIAARERQQITYPLDNNSLDVLNQYFMRITAELQVTLGAHGNIFTSYIGQQGNALFEVFEPSSVLYSANPTDDTLTVLTTFLTFVDDTALQVFVETAGAAPAPLVVGTVYFAVNGDGRTFQLSKGAKQSVAVDTVGDTLTTSAAVFANNDKVRVTSSTGSSLPAPLVVGTTYFVVNTAGAVFQLSATSGGSAINLTTTGSDVQVQFAPIDITDAGTGRQLMEYAQP